jgi:single-stranded-DNA-specific exonuclease
LCARGLDDAEAARRYLSPAASDLHDPYLLKDMDRAAIRLAHAVQHRESILLYGDYDVDGTTAVVVLKKAISLAGGTAMCHVPHRLRDGRKPSCRRRWPF